MKILSELRKRNYLKKKKPFCLNIDFSVKESNKITINIHGRCVYVRVCNLEYRIYSWGRRIVFAYLKVDYILQRTLLSIPRKFILLILSPLLPYCLLPLNKSIAHLASMCDPCMELPSIHNTRFLFIILIKKHEVKVFCPAKNLAFAQVELLKVFKSWGYGVDDDCS